MGRTIWLSSGTAIDDVVEERPAEQNKRMQQTRGGWRRVESSWSAIPRAAVIAGEGKVVRPSQLIRGVGPTRRGLEWL